MDNTSFFQVALTLLSISTLYLLHRRRITTLNRRRFPPGPSGWPILGNLLDLGLMPHRTLTKLRKQYGDIIGLRLGSMNTMVILSAKAAAEFFKNHDISFAERTITETMRVHGYNQGSLALAPYGSYWRVLRKLVTVDMLVTKKITDTTYIRRKCVDDMLRWIEEESSENKIGDNHGIHVAKFVFLMSMNLLGNLMLSRDLVDPESRKGSEFFEAMMGLMETSGYANVADYFPWLKWVDPQGLRRKMEKELGKALEIASEFVKERIEEVKVSESKRKDFLDVLLEFKGNGKDEPEKISDHDVNIFILEIFMAGSETTSSTNEWALTELLLHPDSMKKAKSEILSVVGPNKKLQESHIENLPFLQAIVKETLRLHPPIPFLVPRKAIQDTNFMGYNIPQNTQVLVNTWAIGRDSEVWDDPLCFKPERFMGSNNVDYRGLNYEFIPFGAGRRMCAGVSLAHRVLHLVLGSLIHEFDWEFCGNVDAENVDMGDRLGITMRKSEPLLAVPKKCNV
ncbi:cytochrome P450 76A1-like [Euphorbia lathyris]|uniref:cytochrome P450 76A1-like n=1 Tax=Euphorbia lathyris TaxID=212925 RepID=UPI003313B411